MLNSPTAVRELTSVVLLTMCGLLAACGGSGDDAGAATTDQAEVDTDSAPVADERNDPDAEPDTTESDDDASDEDEGDGNSTDDDDGSDDEPVMAASSPIGAYFADDGGFEASINAWSTSVEEEITRCMASEGFEYRAAGQTVPEFQRLQSELTTTEWIARFGFGVSTTIDALIEAQRSDPNGDLLTAMTDGERDAWIMALVGDVDPSLTEPPPLEEQGCIGTAIITMGGDEVFEPLEALGETYDELDAAIFDEPVMIDVMADWSACLAEAGWPGYGARDEPEADIQDRFDTLMQPVDQAVQALDDAELQKLIDGDDLPLDAVPGLDVQALLELQDEERAVASASWDCYKQHVQSTYEPLRDELENRLIDENRSALDALRTIGS